MANGRKLVIVESPAKARTIAGYLGDDFTVEASVGHIRDLPQPSELPADMKKGPFGKFAVDVENASLDDVCGAAKPLILEHVRKCERDALDRLAQGVGTGGRGAAGIDEVLDALNQARVETLLIGERPTPALFDKAADLLLEDARGQGHNDFKITLVRRALAAVLAEATGE